MRMRPTKKRAYGEEAGNEDQPSSPRKESTAKKNKKGRGAAIRREKKQAEAMRETEKKHEPEPNGDPMLVDSEVPPSEQQRSASPKVPPPCQASHSRESDDQSDAQDSDDEGADMAEELSGDTAGDDAAYDGDSVLESFVKALYANRATEEDVKIIMGALPSTMPTPTQISAILIAAYAAFWTMTGGLGVPSLVWAMVGLVPLVAGVLHYTQVVYCMHFPVDEDHMMGAGKETRWGFKNIIGRFVGHDGKPVQTGCCTGYYLLLLQQYLPFKYVPIIDLFPFVNRARAGGFSPGNPLHVAALSKKINMWLANGVRIWRIGSRTGVLGALSVLEGLKAEGCKHFDVKVDVGRQKVRVHVFTCIRRPDGSTTPLFLIGSHHLCLYRMPWIALYIIACEILMFCLLNVGLSRSKLQKLYRSVKNSGLTDEEQHERFELLLSEMEPADRAEVEALQRDEGKTLLEAYNSWKSRTTGRRCVRPGCLCTRPQACICDKDHPHTQHGQLSAANTGFVYATPEKAAEAAHILDNLPDLDDKLSFRVDWKDAKKVVVVLDAGTRKKLRTREKIDICDAVAKHAPGGKAAHGNQQTVQSKAIEDGRARGLDFVMVGEKKVSTKTKTQGDGGTEAGERMKDAVAVPPDQRTEVQKKHAARAFSNDGTGKDASAAGTIGGAAKNVVTKTGKFAGKMSTSEAKSRGSLNANALKPFRVSEQEGLDLLSKHEFSVGDHVIDRFGMTGMLTSEVSYEARKVTPIEKVVVFRVKVDDDGLESYAGDRTLCVSQISRVH